MKGHKLICSYVLPGFAIYLENPKGERKLLQAGRPSRHKIKRAVKATEEWEAFLGLKHVTEYTNHKEGA